MRTVIALVLWILVILGALPETGQRELESRLAWWHPRLMALLSSFVEAFSGWQFLREVLFRSELNILPAAKALPLGFIGLFLLIEGLLRLGVSLKLTDTSVPSLPVALAYKGIKAFLGRGSR